MRFSLFAGASFLALTAAAVAQEGGGSLELGPVVVTGDALAAGFVAVEERTATKTETPLLETQQSVSVVTGDQIREQGAQTLGQALGYSAGILAEPFGADPRFDSPVIRGFEARESQYLNGLRLMRSIGAPSYEIYGLERVEVLKGPASALYGAGSPAGVINQVQKRARFEDFNEVGLGAGDPRDFQGYFDVNRATGETFAFRLTGIARDTEQDIEEITDTRGYIAGATRWLITPTTTLDLLGSYQKDDPITPAGLPYNVASDTRSRRDLYIGDPSFDDSDRRMANIGYELRQEIAGGWSLYQGLRYQSFDWDYRGFYTSGPAVDDTVTRGVIWQDEDTSTVNVDTRLQGQVATGAVAHDLLLGLDLRHYDDNTTTQFGSSSPFVIGDGSTRRAVVSEPWFTSVSDLKLDQIGVYAQDQLAWDKWRGTLSLRHDWARQKGTTFTNFAGATDVDEDDSKTTGHAGVSYVFDSGVAPYVSYSTSFDPELGVDISGRQLEPTEGKQWEAGVKYQPEGFDALITAAIYDLRQENVPVTVTEGGITGTRQIGEVKSRGFELEGTAALDRGWDIRAAYAYNDAEQVGGVDDGKAPANTPENTGSLWLNYAFAENSPVSGLSLAGGLRYIGKRYGDNANLYEMDDVTVFDAAARYRFRNGAELAVNASNLTDKVYLANCATFGCYYGAGRSVVATLSYRW